MSKEELINILESNRSWSLAKHRCASELLHRFKSKETVNYIWNKFVETGDYYYASIVKDLKYE